MKNCLSILCLKIVNVYREETEIKFYKYGLEREIMANLLQIKYRKQIWKTFSEISKRKGYWRSS